MRIRGSLKPQFPTALIEPLPLFRKISFSKKKSSTVPK